LKITEKQKNIFIRSLFGYAAAFVIIKMIFEKGVPEDGWTNLIFTSLVFGLIMGVVNIFLSRKKER